MHNRGNEGASCRRGRVCHGEYEHLLEPIWRGLETSVKLHLVNPYFIKQLPGKKSDVKEAEWIATCLHHNLIASIF